MNSSTGKPSTQVKLRGYFHIVFGLIYLIIAGIVVYAERNRYIEIGATFSYIVAGLFSLYGLFRIYRGYRRVAGKENSW